MQSGGEAMEDEKLYKRFSISMALGLVTFAIIVSIVVLLSPKSEPVAEYIWRDEDTIYIHWRHGKITWTEEIETMTIKDRERLNKLLNGDTKTIIE